MKKMIYMVCAFSVLISSLPISIFADDLIFEKTKIVALQGEKMEQIDVIVSWKSDKVEIELKDRGKKKKYGYLETEIPYDKMSDLTYEYSKHWRVVSAILVTPWLLFSKRKHHWYSFKYKNAEDKEDAVVLRIDKKEVLLYKRRVPAICGLELTEHIED